MLIFKPMFKKIKNILFLVLALFLSQRYTAQVAIDKVIGVVAKYPILLSDLQTAMLEQTKSQQPIDKCKAMEALVYQKLLLAQADRDSVTVTDQEVETELSRRMAYFINQFGSEDKLEEFYGKRTNVIKDELRSDVQEQLIAQKMASKITGDGKITPAETRLYYKSLPEDSLPLINSEVELQQIAKMPQFSKEAKLDAKTSCEELRKRVINGESMAVLAGLYTEDGGSKMDRGLIKNMTKGMMVPEFEATAFRLKEGEISNVFETNYGYHFIQLIARKGELLDVRHILKMPKMQDEDYYKCKKELDTIAKQIREGKITFEDAAKKYSDDKDTKQNGGILVNQRSANTKFSNEELSQTDPNIIITLNNMTIGDITNPMQFVNPADNKGGYRILKLKNRIDPHKANMKDDYQLLNNMAAMEHNKKSIKDWIKKRSKITYIKIDNEYICNWENDWTLAN